MIKKTVENIDESRATNHSVFNILVEVTIFTKDKAALINENVNEIIYGLFTRISKEHGVQVVKWHHEDCSVQMLLSISPSTNLTKYINATKASSSRLLKKYIYGLSLALPDWKFWGRGFYAFSLDAKNEKTKNKKRVNIK